MDFNLLKKGLINKKNDDNLTVGTVTSLSPLKVKIYTDDDEINVVATTSLMNCKIGSRILMTKYGNQYIGTNVISDFLPYESYIVKPSDTSRSSTTTLTDDPHLTLSLPRNGIYEIIVDLNIDGSDNGQDIKIQYSYTNLSTVARRSIQAIGTNATSTFQANAVHMEVGNIYSPISTGVVASGWTYRRECMVASINDSDGSITLQWAQVTSGANAIVMKSNSRMFARKIGMN